MFILLAFSVLAGWAATARAITINPTYVDGGGYTWDSVRKGVIQQAIDDWEAALPDSHTIAVTFDFTNAGTSYLGQWAGSYSLYAGTDIYPWTTGVTHTIHFNTYWFTGSTYTWWDPTPATSGDLTSSYWDALSVARHEIGHMLGFVNNFYLDNFYTPQAFDKWGTHISGSTFDPGGLNVAMASSSDLSHVNDGGTTAGDLMVPALVNGMRRMMSATDLNMMHLAYDYTVVIPTTSTTYTLSAAAGKTRMHLGDSCTITSTIVNTGTGTADTLDFTGLRATASSGGTVGGSSTSGGPLAKGGGSASNAGQTFTSSATGTYTITPAVTSATNHTLGTAATLTGATPASVTVYSGQGVWNTAGSGNWSDFSKWTTAGGVPGIDGTLSASDTATFSQYFSIPTTVSLNGATPRLDTLHLNPYTNSLTIARGTGGTLTMQATSGYAEILGYHGISTISAPVILGSDLWINSNPGVTLNFTGGISGNHTLTVVCPISATSIRVGTLQIGYGKGNAAAVPEPSAWGLLAMGAAGAIAGYLRRRKE